MPAWESTIAFEDNDVNVGRRKRTGVYVILICGSKGLKGVMVYFHISLALRYVEIRLIYRPNPER